MNLFGFTENLIIVEAYRSLNDVYENLNKFSESTLNAGYLNVFEWKLKKVVNLPYDERPVSIHPDPHLLTDILDAAYSWARILGDRICLEKNRDKHWEEPLEDLDAFPYQQLKEARYNRVQMIELMDELLGIIVENQLSMLDYVETVEEMAEGIIIRELLETSLPIDEWVEKIRTYENIGPRYRVVRDLYDATNYMNRMARRADPDNRFYYTYRWPKLSLPLLEFSILN